MLKLFIGDRHSQMVLASCAKPPRHQSYGKSQIPTRPLKAHF